MKGYLQENEAKKEICEYGRRLYERGFVAANDGNITIKTGENEVWATPTGVSKGYMNPDMMVKISLDGELLSKSERKPSSELKMHLRVYKENPNVRAVVHAHPPYATAFAIAGKPLYPDTLAEPMFMIGEIAFAPFGMPGTYEVPDSIAPFCKTHDVALLANHGAIAWGENIEMTYFRMESLEHFCRINLYSRYILQEAVPIPEEKAALIRMAREDFRNHVNNG